MTNGTATSVNVVIAGKVASRARREPMAASMREYRDDQGDRAPERDEQRHHEQQQHRLHRPGVHQDRLIDADPGHRRDQQEAQPQAKEPDPPRQRPVPDPARPGEVPGAEHDDERRHRRVKGPLGDCPGQRQRRRAMVSGRERTGQREQVSGPEHGSHASRGPRLRLARQVEPPAPAWTAPMFMIWTDLVQAVEVLAR
jgi:hypothetical protein